MENNKGKRPVRKRPAPPKKNWILRNTKGLAIAFLVLFVFQSMRGCVNSSSYERKMTQNQVAADSVINQREFEIDQRDSIIEIRDDRIQYLEYELKIAGIKVEAADERAKAVQRTAERVKNNTTTTIKIEADTTKNRINQQENE